MNITIKIDAPELVGAIESLALALSGTGLSLPSANTAKNTADNAGNPTVATETMYFSHSESDSVFIVEKGEEFAHLELVEEITKAKYTKLKAEEEEAALAAELKKQAAAEKAEKAKKATELAAIKKANAALAIDVAPEGETQGITLEVVRGKLAAHAAQGKEQQIEVRDALSRFGVRKLTDVETSDYAELLELVGVAL